MEPTSLPHFTLTTIDGRTIRYEDVWQRKHLALVIVPDDGSPEAAAYAADLTRRRDACAALDSECVVTTTRVEGLPAPSVTIADRWGAIAFATAADDVKALPRAEDILDWLEHLQNRCPECEGEAR